jgi:DNA primase small subunit
MNVFSQDTLLDFASDYYSGAELHVTDVASREFMFRFGAGYHQRHQHFPTMEAARKALVAKPPHHFYSSVAYYLDPGFKDLSSKDGRISDPLSAPAHLPECVVDSCICAGEIDDLPGSMLKKGWQGADLFFDLDGDHLPGVEGYMDLLEKVSKDALRLYDDFLIQSHGILPEEIDIRFSGSRGFHFYVDHEFYQTMNRPMREGMQNDILGNEINKSALVEKVSHSTDKYANEKVALKLHSVDWFGWASRFTKTMFDMCKDLLAMLPEDREETVRSWWPRKTTSKSGTYKRPRWVATDREGNLVNPPKKVNGRAISPITKMLSDRRIIKRLAETGDLTWAFNNVGLTGAMGQNSFIEMVMQQAQLRYGCEIDPILADIKRQHRVPGSLHLGRGMPCFRIDADMLGDIPALLTRASEIIGGTMVSTKLHNDITIDLGAPIEYTAGIHEMPRWKALLAVCADEKQTKRKKADASTAIETPAI